MTPSSAPVAPVASVRALLRRVIDYAGLFPPASLGMANAIAEYAEQQHGEHAWTLGRFVVPAARLDEFDEAAGAALPTNASQSWALAALLGSDLEEDIERIEQFNARHVDAQAGAVMVDTVELKASSTRDVVHAAELLDRRFDTYMEVPIADDPGGLVASIAGTTAKAKIRMGGVTADAFPSSANVVRFIARCHEHRVAFKATAGLHHPWRNEYSLTYAADAPRGTMFGFLNLLLATAAVRASWPEADAVALLEERDPGMVQFTRDGAAWRGRTLSLAQVKAARESLTTIGSCSFRDPIADLQAGALL